MRINNIHYAFYGATPHNYAENDMDGAQSFKPCVDVKIVVDVEIVGWEAVCAMELPLGVKQWEQLGGISPHLLAEIN